MTATNYGFGRGSPNGTIGNFKMEPMVANCSIGTNGITNGTIGRTLNDIGILLVSLVEP